MESLLIRLVNRDSPKHLEHQGVLLFFLFFFFSFLLMIALRNGIGRQDCLVEVFVFLPVSCWVRLWFFQSFSMDPWMFWSCIY